MELYKVSQGCFEILIDKFESAEHCGAYLAKRNETDSPYYGVFEISRYNRPGETWEYITDIELKIPRKRRNAGRMEQC